MAPDTEREVVKINLKMLSALTVVIMFGVGCVAWGVRLEYRAESNAGDITKLTATVEALRHDRQDDHDKLTRQDGQITFILQGIEEIKTLLKDRKP